MPEPHAASSGSPLIFTLSKAMRFHDYHLKGYSVSDFGRTILLDLIYDYEERPVDISEIEFSSVTLYHFVHTTGAIILDILPTTISRILSDYADEIIEWARCDSLQNWTGSLKSYEEYLLEAKYSAWKINSAIGFHGFVIGMEVNQRLNKTVDRTIHSAAVSGESKHD